ncbi:MAG: AAA family ATPase, partial [Deltaproteobacteria bacterium]
MKESAHNAVRFEKLLLQNYGVFAGVRDFEFNAGRTVIVGRSGSGKTTFCRALAYLRAARHLLPNEHAGTAEMKVTVTTSGNRDLIRKYRRLIFLRDRDMAACGKQAP